LIIAFDEKEEQQTYFLKTDVTHAQRTSVNVEANSVRFVAFRYFFQTLIDI